MSSPSKIIGTKTETMATRYLRDQGFEHAERRVLAGANDVGDILVTRQIIAQVKGGKAAETASDLQLRKWCEETEQQRINAGVEHAFLIVKRAGHGATKIGGWWVVSNNLGLLCRFRLDEYVAYLKALLAAGEPDDSDGH